MFRFLRCCCDKPDCPPCPAPFQQYKGWTQRPINGCNRCPVPCEPCTDFPQQVGYNDTFIENCPRCPKCVDDPCYIRKTAGEVCDCLATRFKIQFVGVNSNCSCFINACPPVEPAQHDESAGSLGSYCSTDFPINPMLNHKRWGNDGPGCAAPATLLDDQTGGFVTFAVGYGGGGVHVDVQAASPFAGVFDGHISGQNCKGPWIVPNNLSGCFVHQPLCDGMTTSSGGFAIVTPCAC